MTPRFALIGAAGFVAPRHLEAIKQVGGKLVAALDPHDAVGILDRYDRETEFFTEPERFERHLEKLRRKGEGIDWLSVCSPNYLHDAHIRMGMRLGANVICEKPIVINPWNLDALAEIEKETGKRIYTVLQLRHGGFFHEGRELDLSPLQLVRHRFRVHVEYITPRGRWYHQSWKGDPAKSGGLIMNIGVHMLDLLLLLFGKYSAHCFVDARGGDQVVRGDISLDHADVSFLLSIEGGQPQRTLLIDGVAVDLTKGFENLHTKVYEETLAGRGHGIDDARPAVELAHRLRRATRALL